MGEAVVEVESNADVERRRLSAVDGSERTRGRGANEKDDMFGRVLSAESEVVRGVRSVSGLSECDGERV